MRVMLLMSAHNAQEYANFTPETGMLEYFSANAAEQAVLQSKMSGRYAVIEDTRVLFYRENLLLKLRLGEQIYEVREDIAAEHSRDVSAALIEQVPSQRLQTSLSQLLNAQNTFKLLRVKEALLTFKYTMPIRRHLIFDPTPFIEDEDFDFMLFVHNVINSPDRRDSIWNSER